MVEYLPSSLDQVFAAVADPTRRAILQALSERPATIGEIARPFSVSLNAVSKHVMVLERAGLLRREVHGREHVCRLQARPLEDATAWMQEGNEVTTLVTVEFLARGGESELLLTHERFTQGDAAQRYQSGWGTIAQKLAAFLARTPAGSTTKLN